MKCRGWLLLAAALVATSALAGPATSPGTDKPPTAEQMDLIRMGLELKAREAGLAQEHRLRELELEERRLQVDRLRRRGHRRHPGGAGLLLLPILALHVLLTVWVCKDMRERGIGRALWVPIVLLGGIFAAILYAIVRIDDAAPVIRRNAMQPFSKELVKTDVPSGDYNIDESSVR